MLWHQRKKEIDVDIAAKRSKAYTSRDIEQRKGKK